MTITKPLTTTPCVGLCSTVFGDCVCRGCMRFIHEVIDWNRYNDEQKTVIWQRLDEHLRIILPQFVRIYDPIKLINVMQAQHIPYRADHIWRCVYDLLCTSEKRFLALGDCGFALKAGCSFTDIHQQLYTLATAYYERDFLRAQHWLDDHDD